MSEASAKVTKRRISGIWIVPIVALLLGAWMVYWTWQNQGPEITITFATAEGIEAGKTKIKTRSVEVGLVESVGLGKDLQTVVVSARLEPEAADLLREDTQFWVEKVRIGMGGISGLGTLLSGGHIQLTPGQGPAGRRGYVGLEEIPSTPIGTAGLRFALVAESGDSLSTGDPILYKGFQVGRVETTEFDVESQRIRHSAFIDAPYDSLVTSTTRFWNASGLSFSATADGIKLRTGSLQSILLGGVSLGLPDGFMPGHRVDNDTQFVLHPNRDSINEKPYRESLEFVVAFNQSIRGLRPGAPVEYRGLPAGQVERVLLDELVAEPGHEGEGNAIPVLLRLEPGRLRFGDNDEGMERLNRAVVRGVPNGLRAALATGNLLTGGLLVTLDVYPDADPAKLGEFAGRTTIPTIQTGLEGIELKVTQLLDKLNDLDIDGVVGTADATLLELNNTIAELRYLIASQEIQVLPQTANDTLAELDRTLASVRALANSLEERPSSLLFSGEPGADPEPRAGQR